MLCTLHKSTMSTSRKTGQLSFSFAVSTLQQLAQLTCNCNVVCAVSLHSFQCQQTCTGANGQAAAERAIASSNTAQELWLLHPPDVRLKASCHLRLRARCWQPKLAVRTLSTHSITATSSWLTLAACYCLGRMPTGGSCCCFRLLSVSVSLAGCHVSDACALSAGCQLLL